MLLRGRAVIIAWVTLMAMVVVGFCPISPRVLCVGADGHLAIELPHAQGGCASEQTGDDGATELAELSTHKTCLDLTLAGGQMLAVRARHAQQGDQLAELPPACPLIPQVDLVSFAPANQTARVEPQRAGRDLARRNMVLLI
ncbi:MAG: hypothetical protein WD042_04280 [Phycisphaeraceae bacterium]